jgi:chromosome partitioning protein
LAHGLALRGKKVLLVDNDPQASATYSLGVKSSSSLYQLLIENCSLKSCVTQARLNLDILPSNEHLFAAEIKLASMFRKEFCLKQKLSDISSYDFVFLDCAPSMSLLNQNALIFASEVFLTVSMEYLALIGVKQLLKNIHMLNKLFNQHIKITKVIPTFFDSRNKKSKEIIKSLTHVFPKLISSPIHVSIALSEAPAYKQTIFEFDPNSRGAKDYFNLIEEVLANG